MSSSDTLEQIQTQNVPEKPLITDLLVGYEMAITDERTVQEGMIREKVRLSSSIGDSIALIEWSKPSGHLGQLVSDSAIKWTRATTPETYMFGYFDHKKKDSVEYLSTYDFSPVAKMLGFNYQNYNVRNEHQLAVAKTWVVPSPERSQYVLQNEFGHRPEEGYPKLVSFSREDGSSGILKAQEFFQQIVAGNLPISTEADVPQRLHDSIIHAGYTALPASLFQYIRQLAKEELLKPHNWDNLPEDSSAAVFMKSFDGLTAQMTGILEVYKSNHSSNHDKFTNVISNFIDKVAPDTKDLSAIASRFGMDTVQGVEDMITIAKNQSLTLAA